MVYSLDDITWGGSGIERVVFDFIRSKIPDGSTVVELGAGLVSTKALSLFYNLYSVEHEKEFLFKFENVRYIYAPNVNGWYDASILEKCLPEKQEQKLVLIDGLNRRLILKHLHLFNPDALFIVHDTNRDNERLTVIGLSKILKRKAEFHSQCDYWASI